MENISNTKAPDGKPQRRSVFAILAGLMVIGFFLLCVGFGMSGFFCHDSMLFVFSLVFLPFTLLFVWLAYKQYCALFCCEPIAARAWHETWLGLGFFLLFGSVANILDDFPAILKDDEIFSKNVIGWTIVFVMFVCGLLFPVIGWLLRQQTIRRQKPFLPAGQKFLKIQSGSEYRFQKVIGVILMSVCVILFVAYIVSEDYPEIGEHYSYEQSFRIHFRGDFHPKPPIFRGEVAIVVQTIGNLPYRKKHFDAGFHQIANGNTVTPSRKALPFRIPFTGFVTMKRERVSRMALLPGMSEIANMAEKANLVVATRCSIV
jgi:hypothetical protein